jgi:hypothetical protein
MDQDQALALVFAAVDIVNRQLPPHRRLERSPDTIIIGEGASLDSLGIVNFVHAIEQQIEEATGRPMNLLREDLLRESGPFRSAGSAAAFLVAMAGR